MLQTIVNGGVIIVSAWLLLKGVGWGSLRQEERDLDSKQAKASLNVDQNFLQLFPKTPLS